MGTAQRQCNKICYGSVMLLENYACWHIHTEISAAITKLESIVGKKIITCNRFRKKVKNNEVSKFTSYNLSERLQK